MTLLSGRPESHGTRPVVQSTGRVRPRFRNQSIHATSPVKSGETQSVDATPAEVQGKGLRSPKRKVGIRPEHRGKCGFLDDSIGTIRPVLVLVVRHGAYIRSMVEDCLSALRAEGIPLRWTWLQPLPDALRVEVVVDGAGREGYSFADIAHYWATGEGTPEWLIRVDAPASGPADRSRGTGHGEKPRRILHPIAWAEDGITTDADRADMEARNYLAWCMRHRQF